MFHLVNFPVSFYSSSLSSGGPFPASGQHVETLQTTLQAADKAWTQQGPAGRGKHRCTAEIGAATRAL